MADEPADAGEIEEPSLPFGLSAADSPEGDLTGEVLGSTPETADSESEPESDTGLVEDQAEEGGSGPGEPGAGVESASESEPVAELDIEVLDDEPDPAVEMAVVEAAEFESATESDEDTAELEALAEGPSVLDDFSHDDYVSATTVEYQGLADAIEAADQEETQLQAVAVTMPGLESGVVGFDDVTGEQDSVEAPPREQLSSDLGRRITTALILMGLLVAALWAGGGWFVAFVTVIGIMALGEFYGTMRSVGYQPIALIGFVALIAMMIAGFRYGPFGIVGWFTAGVVAVLIWYAIVVRRDPLSNASLTVLGFAWVGVLLSFIGPLAATASFRQLILAIVLVAAALDVGSYFAGRAFGRHKMSPILSPNKTYEGLLGGIMLAVAMSVGLSFIDWFAPLDFRGAWFLVGVVVVLGPFGDLAVSMLKRQIGVKDMGSSLPGHGGVLDRIDALLFIIPVAYFVFSWLGYFAS